MKKKTSTKTASRKISSLPSPATNKDDAATPGLKFFEESNNKTHAEIVAAVSPKFAEHQAAGNNEAIEIFAGLFWGCRLDFGVVLPDWTKQASKLFWQSTGIDFLFGKTHEPPQTLGDLQPRDLGKIVGLIELAFQQNCPKTSAEQAGSLLAENMKLAAANFPPDEAKQFFDGRASAKNIAAKMEALSQRAKVFLFIAVAWRQVENMPSAGRLHRWLVEHDLIARATDPAETRAVCRMIGFHPRNKAGRPLVRK